MLVGAFTAVAVSYFTGSWLLGIIAAMIAGAVIAMIMAVGHIRYNSEICAIGMGINLLALALTKFMVNAIFHSTGSFSSPDIKAIPRVSLRFLDNLPVVGDLFNNWCVTEWFVPSFLIIRFSSSFIRLYGDCVCVRWGSFRKQPRRQVSR